MAPKAKQVGTMKQGTLAFASSKRGAAAATAGGKANVNKGGKAGVLSAAATPFVSPKPPAAPAAAGTEDEMETDFAVFSHDASESVRSASTAPRRISDASSIRSFASAAPSPPVSAAEDERSAKRLKTTGGARPVGAGVRPAAKAGAVAKVILAKQAAGKQAADSDTSDEEGMEGGGDIVALEKGKVLNEQFGKARARMGGMSPGQKQRFLATKLD